MKVAHIFFERLSVFPLDLAIQIRFFNLCQHQFFQTGQIFRRGPLEMNIFFHRFFQFFQFIIGAGLGLGRGQMFVQYGSPAPLGLDSLACNGHIVNIHVGQIPQ